MTEDKEESFRSEVSSSRSEEGASPVQTSSDRIFIRDLLIRCIVGVEDHERQEKQDVVAHITLWIDLRRAGRSDELADSIDYSALKKQVLRATESSRYHLIEALAQRIADECLRHERIECVRVVVEKPGALRFARTVGVDITRRRDSIPGEGGASFS